MSEKIGRGAADEAATRPPSMVRRLLQRPADDHRTLDSVWLLAVSAWLIVNSHLEAFYPAPWLAADGLLGNSMFFLLSGYGVTRSLMARQEPFPAYFPRRLLRIYPSVLIALAFFAAIGVERIADAKPMELVAHFIWPTPYTYVRLIVPFYAALWLLSRGSIGWLVVTMAAALCAYGWGYWNDLPTLLPAKRLSLGLRPEICWVSDFWIMTALGALMARIDLTSRFTRARCVGLAGLLAAYFGLKYLMVVRGVAIPAYPVLEILVATACVTAFATFCGAETVRWLAASRWIGPLVVLSANLTLEIYVFHEPLTKTPFPRTAPFPLNILSLIAITLVGATILHLLALSIRDRLTPARSRPA